MSAASSGGALGATRSEPGSVSVIDTSSNTVSTTAPVEFEPQGVAVAPDGRHVYIANVGSWSVSVMDTGSG
jgi:YVTN family beta-propeller protein